MLHFRSLEEGPYRAGTQTTEEALALLRAACDEVVLEVPKVSGGRRICLVILSR